MKALSDINLDPITYLLPVLTREQVVGLRDATHSVYSIEMIPTFATVFRKAEFEFLDRCEVDMRLLLHVEQEYEYFSPLAVGDIPEVTTKILEIRERRGMFFFTLRSEVSCGGLAKTASNTQFVVRPPSKAGV